MSHNLNITNGRASMMYIGEAPWHNLGTRLSDPATAQEAIQAAGLDFTVTKKPLQAVLRGRHSVEVPAHYATVRTDTNAVLGVVGSRYEPIQNMDCFRFFDPLVARDEAIYHTGGALERGERIWLLARLPDYIRIRKRDIVDKYVLLYNSHDGSSNVRIKMTPVRVVCQNTLSTALSGSEQEVRIRHTPSAQERLAEAHKLLGLTNRLYEELDYIFNRMALRRLKDQELKSYVRTLIPDNPEAESNTRTVNVRNKVLELHESGHGAEMHRGTAFGAYNAVTELVDHHSSTRDASKLLKSIWFGGSGERLKIKAFNLAQETLLN